MNQEGNHILQTPRGVFGLIVLAFAFGVALRMIWVFQFWDNPSVWWNGQMMINTNDGYYFASVAEYILEGLHSDNWRAISILHQGTAWITVLFVKILPFSLETIMFYMPLVFGSFVVIPLVLIGSLYQKPLWGFFAALVAVIGHSYYNRTMIGYYDTDMFIIWVPLLALYFLFRFLKNGGLENSLYASLLFVFLGFVYTSSGAIISGLVLWFAIYALIFERNKENIYATSSLLFVVLLPFFRLTSHQEIPWGYLVQVLFLVGLFFFFKKTTFRWHLVVVAILFILMLIFGNTISVIFGKINTYLFTGTMTHGLKFFGVAQTVREASSIDIITLANRIAGSWYGLLIGLVGYGFLVAKHRAFLLLLPLLGAGFFAYFGGLRFTIFAVPIVALGGTYILVLISQKWLKSALEQSLFFSIGMFLLLYPNITHIIGYKVPTVMIHDEVADLEELKTIANPKDFTLSWWDYGYPLWFYTNTSTLIDGGKHHNDNFILSTIFLTNSPKFASNFARASVEEYVDFLSLMQQKSENKEAQLYASMGYGDIIDVMLRNRQDSQLDPKVFLDSIASGTYEMPEKTRDIYLYFPIRMLSVFQTVTYFGNIDLTTGEPLRKIEFYPSFLVEQREQLLIFHNQISFDYEKGVLYHSNTPVSVYKFVTVDEKLDITSLGYFEDGKYIVLFVKSQGIFVVLDRETFGSMFVQMGILGIYDDTLFERVVSSPSSQIYRLKN